jgi:15-cis-phytoene synthase
MTDDEGQRTDSKDRSPSSVARRPSSAIREAFAYCERAVRSADKDRFLSSLFAPATRRGSLFALYALNLELAAVRERVREPLAGEVRLQWWQEIIAGTRSEPGNPVALAVMTLLANRELPPDPLLRMIDARRRDLYRETMATMRELEDYAVGTTSMLVEAAMHVLNTPHEEHVRLAASAGVVAGITGALRNFAFDAARGKVYVPDDILQRCGTKRDDILAGRATPEVRAALNELQSHVQRRLREIRPGLGRLREKLVPALLPLALVPAYLDRMERKDYEPFRTPVDVPQWRKQWLLWRAARDPRRLAGL